ncbi:MAG: cation:proton antiporter [Chloroflexi bacterium]|nr:cation:proton antiporter [Chloroflexota bacterium]
MSHTLPLLAGLAIVIAAAKLSGSLANRFGQPAVMGELLIGLVLGPSALGLFDAAYFSSAGIHETLEILGQLGVIFLMFSAGLEVDLEDFLKAGRPAALAGTIGVIVPVALGPLAALPFGYDLTHGLFIGIVLAATSVSISAQTLMELKRLRSPEGIVLLGAAVVDDVLAIIVLSVFVAVAGSAQGGIGLVWILIRMAAFFVGASLLGRLLPRAAAWSDQLPVSEGGLAMAIIIALLFAWASEVVGGVAAITGAFVAGVSLARSHLHRQISAGMRTLAYSFFVPIFLVNIGLSANVRQLSAADYGLAVMLCLVAVVSKVLGSGVGAKLGRMTWPQSLRVGLGMISRGEVGLIVAGVGVSAGLIGDNVFTAVIVMVLFSTIITPPLLRLAFREKESENVTTHRDGHG